MIELIFLFSSAILLLNILFEVYELIFKKNLTTLLWKIFSIILSLFLIIFGLYIFFNIEIIQLNNIILFSVLLYYLCGIFVLIIISISYKSITKLKNNEINFKKEREVFLIENKNLQQETKLQTIELSNKVTELENVRSAMINILEDVNEQNQELESSKEILEKVKKRLERQNKELLSLDQQKDQFTSITAHELKTPLSSIHGFVQLLKNEKIINDKEKRVKYMDIILHDTDRLSRLISDILDISRIDLGTLKFYFEEFDTKDLLEKIEKEMSSIIKEKNINTKFIIKNGTPKNFYSDKNRLSQVLTNLINNAVHYTEEKGSITVTLETIKGVGINKNKKELLFRVKDTGMGISKENQVKIFERFYQIDSWLTRKIGGSGLGLAISKGIVSAFGGKLNVKSSLGKGSEFYFNIPYKEQTGNTEEYKDIFSGKNKAISADTKKARDSNKSMNISKVKRKVKKHKINFDLKKNINKKGIGEKKKKIQKSINKFFN